VLRAVIADDEPLARRRLRSLLEEDGGVQVVAECANGLEALAAVGQHEPDVVFLDVQMPGATGIEVLEAMAPGSAGAVVLVTAFDEYAVAAFEHHALDYVLKPVDEDRFRATLGRVRERLRERRAASLSADALRQLALAAGPAGGSPYLSRLLIRSTQKVTVVDLAEVDWIEAEGDYLRLHTPGRSYLYRGTIGALEERVDPAEFIRIHRSTIVRLARIRELEPGFHGDHTVTLTTGDRLRLSRTYRARLQDALGDRV
jgi:two-component system LytT family response regulator